MDSAAASTVTPPSSQPTSKRPSFRTRSVLSSMKQQSSSNPFSPVPPDSPKLKCDSLRDNWEISHFIGDGTSSIVSRAINRKNGTDAVVKVARPGKKSELQHEADILKHIGRHPYIVSLLGFYDNSRDGTAIVLELLEGGDILQLLKLPITPMHLKSITVQLCEALSFVHSHGIVHRDVKAENIVLVGTRFEVKLV